MRAILILGLLADRQNRPVGGILIPLQITTFWAIMLCLHTIGITRRIDLSLKSIKFFIASKFYFQIYFLRMNSKHFVFQNLFQFVFIVITCVEDSRYRIVELRDSHRRITISSRTAILLYFTTATNIISKTFFYKSNYKIHNFNFIFLFI